MTWQAGNESAQRNYRFTYDGLKRMRDAVYSEGAAMNANANHFNEQVTGYDKNGNILGLKRYGQTGVSTYGLIDDLVFTLNSNRLKAANDAATASACNEGFEFKDGARSTVEYMYDATGNLTKDLNKNIADIQNNILKFAQSHSVL